MLSATGILVRLEDEQGTPRMLYAILCYHNEDVVGSWSKEQDAAVMDKLERAKITVLDVYPPYDTTISQMLARANSLIAGGRFSDRRRAKRLGQKGGKGRGRAAAARREALWKDRWLIDRIVDCQDIPWAIKTELLAPHFPESTLRRHYGAENAAKEADNG